MDLEILWELVPNSFARVNSFGNASSLSNMNSTTLARFPIRSKSLALFIRNRMNCLTASFLTLRSLSSSDEFPLEYRATVSADGKSSFDGTASLTNLRQRFQA
jgi:hypothetical protein